MRHTPRSPRLLGPLLALLALLALCGACSGASTPSPTPGGLIAVFEQLSLRGATTEQVVGGDAGCRDTVLHDNAARLDVVFPADRSTYRVYLLRWRRPADFAAASHAFAACRADYAAGNPGVQVKWLELAPWRAFGPGWSDGFRATLADALAATGAQR